MAENQNNFELVQIYSYLAWFTKKEKEEEIEEKDVIMRASLT